MKWLPAALVAVLLAVPAQAVPAEPSAPTLEDLVADLNHPAFAVREKAQRELWARGEDAIPLLERAAKSEDPETARRAKELLDKFAWGILPNTPPSVLKLIRKFQTGDTQPDRADTAREEAVTELLKLGKPGISAVRAILRKDINPESRAKLLSNITTLIRREVPLQLFAGKNTEAADLMSLHAVGTTPEGAADLAAFHTIRGDLPAAIADAEKQLRSGRRTTETKLVLTYLYRAAGNWKKAIEVSENLPHTSDEPDYKELLLEDAGDWAALVSHPPGRKLNHPDAVKITHLRLAGQTEKFDEQAKRVRDNADELEQAEDIMDSVVALLANHRANEAIELLLERRKNLGLTCEILISHMRYKAALELIGNGKQDKETIPANERLDFNLRRARILMMAGQKDSAVQLFEEVATGLQKQRDEGGFTRSARAMLRTEMRLGLRDLACEHAVVYLPPDSEGRTHSAAGESPFELLFPNEPLVAESLYHVLRANKIPGDRAGATMLRTRDILAGTATAAANEQALKAVREAAANIPADATLASGGSTKLLKARRYHTLGVICRIAKRNDDAEAAFKLAAELTANAGDAADATGARSWVYGAPDPARVWIEWGESLTDVGKFREAASAFEAGWKLFPAQPLPLYLSGVALAKAGDAKEGTRRMELAHAVSLGNERVRGRFLDELVRRGDRKAIQREISLILKACWSRDHYFGNVMNQCARGAALIGDFATAGMCSQRSLLVILRHEGVYFVDLGAYLNVPQDLRVYQARAQLRAGKIAEAMTTARAVLAVTPGHLDLLTGFVADLAERGHKKEADEIFKLGWDAYHKMLAEYPDSPTARHALALLAAHGQRELDNALKYAQAAVTADPGSITYRETLAEVHFRRGERADALKLMQKLRDEHPRNTLYLRQLARYRDAKPNAPWPYTDE